MKSSFSDSKVVLGCGDGRILVESLKLAHPPAQCIGLELDPHLAEYLRTTVSKLFPAECLFKVIEGDMFVYAERLDEWSVSCLILYLLPLGLEKLKPFLETWLKEGSRHGNTVTRRRIVTITYSVPGWECNNAKQFDKSWLFQYT